MCSIVRLFFNHSKECRKTGSRDQNFNIRSLITDVKAERVVPNALAWGVPGH
jgi:hypothetical protein